jgi:exosortase/archaeosortase family protein
MVNYYKNLLIRFLVALIVTLNYSMIYIVLTPVTIYLTYLILNLFYNVLVIDNSIGINGIGFKFIRACIAGAAYYLLFLLIIGLKDINWKKRLNMLLTGSLLILVMNIIRIVVLIVLAVEFGKNYFDAVHLIFWNFVSGAYIALVWIFLVKAFKVDKIPFYSDIKFLYDQSSLKNRKKPKIKK